MTTSQVVMLGGAYAYGASVFVTIAKTLWPYTRSTMERITLIAMGVFWPIGMMVCFIALLDDELEGDDEE